MIVKIAPGKWTLFSHKGKILGVHPTKQAAQAQESAINIWKGRRSGYRIPRRRRAA